jgi:putative transcriptional regulator
MGLGNHRLKACATFVLLAGFARAQPARPEDLAAGKFLVAPRDAPDRHFAETVILLIDYSPDGAAGLIVNRETKVPLSRALEKISGAKERSDFAYSGGPVEGSAVLALLRSRTKPQDARRVFGDVHLISSRALLDKTLAAGTSPDEVRVYLGYAGWGPGQLQREVEHGGWHILRGDADIVFDPEPGSVWRRLVRRTETQVARR